MRKIILAILTLFISGVAYAGTITVTPFITPNDVTISHLETFRTSVVNGINSADGSLLQDGTIPASKLDNNANPEKRWYYAFNEFVISGLLPPTSVNLLSTVTAGSALIKDDDNAKMKYVVKDANNMTFNPTRWTYVDLNSSGTYITQETVINAAEPTTSANSIRLCRVSTDGTAVTVVRDDRVTSLSLGANEDNDRSGMIISVVTPDAITISPGFIYHGSSRLGKTANTTLNLATAADWSNGVSGRTTSTYGFIGIDNAGNIRMFTTAPTKSDTLGNASGVLRYSVVNGTYYRLLAWFYMNTTGSGNIDYWNYSNIRDRETYNICTITSDNNVSTTSTAFIEMDDTTIKFYSIGRPLQLYGQSLTYNTGANAIGQIVPVIDNITYDNAMAGVVCGTTATDVASRTATFLYTIRDIPQGQHTVRMQFRTESNTVTSLKRLFTVEEK